MLKKIPFANTPIGLPCIYNICYRIKMWTYLDIKKTRNLICKVHDAINLLKLNVFLVLKPGATGAP